MVFDAKEGDAGRDP